MVLGEKWIVKQRFDGLPKVLDFELVKEELSPLEVSMMGLPLLLPLLLLVSPCQDQKTLSYE